MASLIAWMLLLNAVMGTARADGCRATNVSVGDDFTCAVLQDGSARCWGFNIVGALGRPDSTTASDPNGPPLDFGAGRSVVQLATHWGSSCALLDDHTVSCWGRNDLGQLGLGDTQDRQQPTHVQLGTGNQSVQLISTGSTTFHSCAVVAGEGVFCWGDAGSKSGNGLQGTPWLGQPSTADITDPLDPTVSQAFLPSKVDLGSGSGSSLTVIDMCAGSDHTCVLTAQLGLKCWGVASNGQLGLGDITDTTGLTGLNLPSVNLGTGRSAVQISCGAAHTCAVLDNGALKCFGYNAQGELGIGKQISRDTFRKGANNTDMGDNLQPVDVGKGLTVKQVTAGAFHTCALLGDSQVKCWGSSDSGQLGHHCSSSTWGNSIGHMGDSLPAVDLGPGRTAVSISAGLSSSCAVLNDNSIKCWGDNISGELGFNSSGANVCPPNQTVDLGSSCTSNTVAEDSTGVSSSLSPTSGAPATPTAPSTPTAPLPLQSPAPAPTQPATPATASPSPSPSTTPTTPPPSPSTTTASSSSSSHSAPVGIIAGAVLAAVVVAALLVMA